MNESWARARWWMPVLASLAVAGGAVLFCFDPSHFHVYPICIFHRATGLLCPGCGSLRALHQILHGNLAAAFHYNPVVVLTLPFVVGVAVFHCLRRSEPRRAPTVFRPMLIWTFLAVVLVFSVWRNIPGSPFALGR